jgi:hypothetical protein
MELTEFLSVFEKAPVDELFHYGVKGMHWGVRKDTSSGNENPGGNAPSDHAKLKKAVKIGAGVAAAAVIVAGTVYVAKHPELVQKVLDSKPSADHVAKGKEFAEKLASESEKEPTGIINTAGAGRLGDVTHRKGGLSDILPELQKAGLVGGTDVGKVRPVDVGEYRRYGHNSEKVAVHFLDPLGRKDAVGRPIHHQIVLPKQHTEGIDSFESAKSKAWSLVKDDYQRYSDYAQQKGLNASKAEAKSLGIID